MIISERKMIAQLASECNENLFPMNVLALSKLYHPAVPRAFNQHETLKRFPFFPEMQVAHAVQQTGFRRQKRFGVPQSVLQAELGDRLEAKRGGGGSPWSSLRQALDEDIRKEQLQQDPHLVHDETYFDRMQNSANHK